MNFPFHFAPRDLLARLRRLSGLPDVDLWAVSTIVARLSPRERRFVSAAGVVLGGMLVYLLLIDPLWEACAHLRVRVAVKEHELSELVALRREHQALRAEIDRVQSATGANFSPVAFLESLANNIVGQDKITAINPAGRETREGADQETIELKLSGVSLRELVELLYKLDTADTVLRPARVSIKKRYKDPYTFDVTLIALAFSTR